MRVRLQNIGLVRDADLAIADLNIIMGPNNSGKSTIASSIYALVKAAAPLRNPFRSPWRGEILSGRSFAHEHEELLTRVFARDSDLTDQQAASELAPILTDALLTALGHSWAAAIEKANAAPLTDLATRTSRRLPLKLAASCEDLGWAVTLTLRGNDVNVKVTPPLAPIEVPTEAIAYFRRVFSAEDLTHNSIYFLEVVSTFAPNLLRSIPSGTHYLPAARAGLLQSHRLVAAAMLQRAPMVGLGELTMPSLSGVVADFVSEILLGERPNPRRDGRSARALRAVADRVETEVLSGKVIRTKSQSGYPEIEFTDSTGRYPLHRTSSTISEVSPIVLLFRMAADPGDLLIIEEPESHLHPHSQTRLASVLFGAANAAPILITTHSEFFLSKINNEIRNLSAKNPRDTRTKGLETSAYVLRQDEDGARLEQLVVDRIDGIPEDSFMKVTEALYEEEIQQERLLEEGR